MVIPTHVHDFICQRIHSVEQLEVLLLLEASPAQTWSAKEVADAVRIDEPMAASALKALTARGLLELDGARRCWRYAPIDAELDQRARATTESYRSARVDVLRLISQCAMDRIRNAHVHAFASAFLIRSDKKIDPK
jgi:DNA-binding MarR family transcriptional regulator